MLIPTKLRE